MRNAGKAELEAALIDAHGRTWAVLADLAPEQWRVAYHPGINPPLWEFGHVAWFTELWVRREAHWDEAVRLITHRPSLLAGADGWFDSGRVPHRDRWLLDLPSLAELRGYGQAVHDSARETLAATNDTVRALYPYYLALFHEDMHAEALAYMRQTLGYSPPPAPPLPILDSQGVEVDIPGGTFLLGSSPGAGFVFDNEKWAHPVAMEPFAMDYQCVSNGAYAEFVAAGAYGDECFWSDAGRAWLRESGLALPLHWRIADDGSYEQRWFGRWQPLPLERPVCHVNAYEAEAFCRWVGRRLPSEAEWEYAASRGVIAWGGSVWEWTASPFAPYPGFSPDPYRDYSRPWFHTHRSVRGGSFVTRPRLRHARYRNFYLPCRNDIFVGFRTCSAT